MTATRPRARADRPETNRQAREWQTTMGHYLAAGLCHRCAAQAAWGHQIGWTRVHAPCDTCAPVVATFAVTAAGGWRRIPPRERRSGRAVPVREVSGTGTPTDSQGVSDGALSGPGVASSVEATGGWRRIPADKSRNARPATPWGVAGTRTPGDSHAVTDGALLGSDDAPSGVAA